MSQVTARTARSRGGETNSAYLGKLTIRLWRLFPNPGLLAIDGSSPKAKRAPVSTCTLHECVAQLGENTF